jgi:hypothetical protein
MNTPEPSDLLLASVLQNLAAISAKESRPSVQHHLALATEHLRNGAAGMRGETTRSVTEVQQGQFIQNGIKQFLDVSSALFGPPKAEPGKALEVREYRAAKQLSALARFLRAILDTFHLPALAQAHIEEARQQIVHAMLACHELRSGNVALTLAEFEALQDCLAHFNRKLGC